MRVLVVEDQDDVSDLVRRALEKDGHFVTVARSAGEADAELSRATVEAAVLDLGLPDGHGLSWCKRVRADGRLFPILVLTAESAVAMRVALFDSGADDYLGKPFAVAELRARVRALGRRAPIQRTVEHNFGDVRLDFGSRRAWLRETEVPLTAREWRVVELLVSRVGAVVPRTDILGEIWGDAPNAESSLEVIIGRIRKKLGPQFVRTIRSEGYAVG